mgnify:CR=1 FL=1
MTKRTNDQWLEDLQAGGEPQERALEDLRGILLRGLPYALNKWLPSNDPRFSALADEVAQETLLRILDRLETFEGRSQFTTWAHKIAVRIALSELRRKRWENTSLDDLVDGDTNPPLISLMMDKARLSPDVLAEQSDWMEILRKILQEELTENQQKLMAAVVIHGMPLEEAAKRMGSNRNALYKMMHDARKRLKNRLTREGLSLDTLLSVF